MNYEQILQAAKDEVAKRHGFKDWVESANDNSAYPLDMTSRLTEAALLAMQRVAEQKELPKEVISVLKRTEYMFSNYEEGTIGKELSKDAAKLLTNKL